MTRPHLFVRAAGSPLGAFMLFMLYLTVGLSWYHGRVPWWLALGAVGAGLRTWRAVRRVRAYKAWSAQWEEMGVSREAPIPERPRSYRWAYFILTALLIAIPFHDNWQNGMLVWVWLFASLVLFVALCAALFRWRRERFEAKGLAAPIAWMMGRASSSPSRAAAQKQLPEYTRLLLGNGKTAPQLMPEKPRGRTITVPQR